MYGRNDIIRCSPQKSAARGICLFCSPLSGFPCGTPHFDSYPIHWRFQQFIILSLSAKNFKRYERATIWYEWRTTPASVRVRNFRRTLRAIELLGTTVTFSFRVFHAYFHHEKRHICQKKFAPLTTWRTVRPRKLIPGFKGYYIIFILFFVFVLCYFKMPKIRIMYKRTQNCLLKKI